MVLPPLPKIERKLKSSHNLTLLNPIMAQSIPSVPMPNPSPLPPTQLSGICHLVGPGGGEFVRKPLFGGFVNVNISLKNMPI